MSSYKLPPGNIIKSFVPSREEAEAISPIKRVVSPIKFLADSNLASSENIKQFREHVITQYLEIQPSSIDIKTGQVEKLGLLKGYYEAVNDSLKQKRHYVNRKNKIMQSMKKLQQLKLKKSILQLKMKQHEFQKTKLKQKSNQLQSINSYLASLKVSIDKRRLNGQIIGQTVEDELIEKLKVLNITDDKKKQISQSICFSSTLI